MKTKLVLPEETNDWFHWSQSLLDLYSTQKQYFFNGHHKVSHNRMLDWILAQETEGINLVMRNMLLDSILSAEAKCAGAGSYVPWFLYNTETNTPIRGSSTDYLSASLLASYSESAKILFQHIYDQVGPLTKIIIKDSYESSPVIKYRNSFCFPLTIDEQFHRVIGHVDSIDQTNPIVIMIEGAPETIGEINSLLEWNHSESRPVLLIARSFPEEISATLATNWIRGSLSVLPITYGTSIESINLAADMVAVTQGELISAHFGDIISSSILNRDKWGNVDRVEWSSRGLNIYKDVNVDAHVNNLIKKMKSIDQEELQSVYRDRILSLSNDAIEVWIPSSEKHVQKELDSIIKHYNGFTVSGYVETSVGIIPHCFEMAAKDSANSLKEKILNIGGFLVGVNDGEVVSSRRR